MEKYEIIRNLGRGSYGSVDLARIRPQPGSPSNEKEQLFAVKKIKLKHMPPEERKKALDEAAVLQKLNHPNIVQFKESFEEKNNFFIVMEYIDGGDLEKKIQQRGNSYMTEREVLFMFVQILSPIAYLHRNKILHRDIKPQNCFITKHGIVKIGDFGVARSLDTTFSLAKTVIGTPFYLAPEIWDNHPYGYAADIYSLGVVLYCMCSLKRPFDAETATQLFTKVMKHDFTPIPYFFSNELRRLVDQMLSKEPASRPSADEILKLPFIQKAISDLVEYNKKQIEEIPIVKPNCNSSSKQEKKGSLIGGRGRLLSMNIVSQSNESFNTTNNSTVNKTSSGTTLKSTQNAKNATIIKTDVNSDNGKSIARKQNVRESKNAKNATIIKQTINNNKKDDNDENDGMDFEDDFEDFEDDFISDEDDDNKSDNDDNDEDNEDSNSFEDDFDDDSFTLLEDVTMRLQESLIPSKVREENKKAVDAFRAQIVQEIGQAKMDEIYTNLKQLEDPTCLINLRKLERENKEAVEKVKELIEKEESI